MMMSAVTLTVGISVAYYNTCSAAFDGEPVIVSYENGEYKFLDFKITDKDIKEIKKKIENVVPNTSINM